MATIQQYPWSDNAKPSGLVARLARVPTPLGGLALGIASLGAAWSMVSPDWAQPLKIVSALIATILVLKIITKFVLHPHLIREELAHPVISSVMPTSAMALMVISQSLLSVIPGIARGLWLVAVICHIVLFVCFVVGRVNNFRLEHMVPSWFVPPVGIIVAAVTSHGMGYENGVYSLFVFGLGCYFVKLPVMLYRLMFRGVIPDAALPTFAIMAAPASLSLAGYLTISDQPDPLLILILAPLALLMTVLVYTGFIRLLRLPFSPGYAAFTFPMVIGATALIKLTHWLFQKDFFWLARITDGLARIELYVATAMVLYVAIRYVFFYLCGARFRNSFAG
ncbi:TDT family transporter [Endozoicomonas sp. Mp262]|uniref:TDT family transporter n=1 Tax=Endozoicomonas sp. Mp262 TaxID=2919499 RepID=UPI0021D882AB